MFLDGLFVYLKPLTPSYLESAFLQFSALYF